MQVPEEPTRSEVDKWLKDNTTRFVLNELRNRVVPMKYINDIDALRRNQGRIETIELLENAKEFCVKEDE